MRLVADSHALVWHFQGSPRLSPVAATALADAEATDGIVVSVASLVDLWYVTQTTEALKERHLADLRRLLNSSDAYVLHPIDVSVADATTAIPRGLLTDPWDRFIAGTAVALGAPLVTRDAAITAAGIVRTIW